VDAARARAGWREFVTLTALFDCDAGFLVGDAVVFSADVLVLRESSEARSVRRLRRWPRRPRIRVALQCLRRRAAWRRDSAPARGGVCRRPCAKGGIVPACRPAQNAASRRAQVPVGDMPEGVIVAQPPAPLALPGAADKGDDGVKVRFTWRIENWTAWKEVMETRKIFSRRAPL
jgi:hypothetical protein